MSSPTKARPATAPVVYTANRLRDGRVVWLAAGGAWVEAPEGAAVFPPEAAEQGAALAKEGERRQEVVGAYAATLPLKFRERLRAAGPTVTPPGYQPGIAA